jgi:hypothetical protein
MSQCLLRMCIAQIVNFELGVVTVAGHFHVNAVTRWLGKSTIGFLCAIDIFLVERNFLISLKFLTFLQYKLHEDCIFCVHR